MWAAPHDAVAQTGVYLFTAPHPAGPWTAANAAAPVITTAGYPSANHLASPYALWDAAGERLLMWAHLGGYSMDSPGGAQRTFLWESTDGINWTILNGGNWVMARSATGDDDLYAAYLSVFHDGTQFVGWYQGARAEPRVSRAMLATSPDGITWTKHGTRFAPSDPALDHNNPIVLPLAGGYALYYVTGENGGTCVYRTTVDGDRFSFPREGMLPGVLGTWDDAKVVPGDFLLYDGRLWLFYTGNAVGGTIGDNIGVASTPFADPAFITDWGKGPVA